MARCPICHHRVADGARCADDDWQAPASVDPPVEGETPSLAGWAVEGLLGAGGFATVWAVARSSVRAPAALKVGHTSHATIVERFRREAEALLRVGPPHAPRLHASGNLEDGRPYLLLERLRPPTLAAWLAGLSRPPALDRALAVADAVLAAVEAAHAKRVVHRDLKPENVLVDEDARRAILLDFGLARCGAGGLAERAEIPLTRTGAAAGTIEYAAPEQLRGDAGQDARADVYSLGVMLYELLTLRPPFVGDARAIEYGHLTLRPRRPSEIAEVPQAIERLVLDCLAKSPARRPQSVAELRDALAAAAASEASAGPRPSAPPGSAMIVEGRRSAVILVVESAASVAAVVGPIAARRGLVVRHRGRRCVALFTATETPAPIEAALAAARELCADGSARAAVHIAPVTLRSRPTGPPTVYGQAVDRPETWLPAGSWEGVAQTPELARIAPQRGDSQASQPALRGRDEALAALEASAAHARSGRPALATLLADHGLGKSRLLAWAAASFRAALPGARVIELRASQPSAGDTVRASRELLLRLGAITSTTDAPAHRLDRARAIASSLAEHARAAPLAILLDDAQWADDGLLDGIELATLQGPAGLWVVVAAQPWFEQMRRGWGRRAERHDRIELGPLAEEAGMELSAELLAPAEYPPAAALAELTAWAGGNPACLVELASALKEAGLVRRREATGSFYLATAELHRLPASPAWQWLAARELDAMPPELSACVRLCAVIGGGLTRSEVERVQEDLERAGAPSTPIDAEVGLQALVQRGLLVPLGADRPAPQSGNEGRAGARAGAEERSRLAGEQRFAFKSAVVQDAVYAMIEGAQRTRIHQAALAVWRARVAASGGAPDVEALERVARHAAAVGARDEAADAYLALGDRERMRHQHVAADARYTAALEHLGEGRTAERARALAGRGNARYRLFRIVEARDDLAAAGVLARSIGDLALLAEVLLEESTVLDWENDFEASEARVRDARPVVEQLGQPLPALRLLVAEGRSAWRHGRVAEAVAALQRGADLAKAAGDYDARVIALLLLSCALVVAGSPDEAEARSDEVIALAAEARDSVHLCAAYGNRFFLWSLRKDLARAVEDMRRALDLARESGNPWPERAATGNLAELLFWCGRDDESIELSRRARALEERFLPRPVHESTLLLARVYAARGAFEEAAALVAWIDERCPPGESAPSAHALLAAVRLLVNGGAPEAWDAVLAKAGDLVPVERLELLYFRARAAASAGRVAEARRTFAEAEAFFVESPDFRRRFEALGL